MHPVIRILCLLALALGLARAAPAALLAASILLVVVIQWIGTDAMRLVLGAARRLRWLLVSVVLLYAWMLPGDPVYAGDTGWQPSWTGFTTGLSRAWMLLVMAVAARLLIRVTGREELVAALYFLLKPLGAIGLSPERFCLRLVLTLEYALEERAGSGDAVESGGGMLERARSLARRRLAEAEARADRAGETQVSIPVLGAPPVLEWGAPVLLLGCLLALTGIS